MLYGYGKQTVNEYGLLELREVTFEMQPSILRELAFFFNSVAQEIESGGIGAGSHRHIGNVVNDWNKRFPSTDIIIAVGEWGSEERSARPVKGMDKGDIQH